MQGTAPVAPSRIRIQVGELPRKPMVRLSLAFSVSRKMHENAKQGYSYQLGTQVPDNCLIFELIPRNGNSQQLASLLKSPEIEQIGAEQFMYDVFPKDQKVYVLVKSPVVDSAMADISSKLQVDYSNDDNTSELKIQVASDSEFDSFVPEGATTANPADYFKNLLIDVELIKTKIMSQLFKSIVEKLMPSLIPAFKVYDKLKYVNMNLKMASSDCLPPQLKKAMDVGFVADELPPKFRELMQAFHNQASVFILSKAFIAQGNLYLMNFAKHFGWFITSN